MHVKMGISNKFLIEHISESLPYYNHKNLCNFMVKVLTFFQWDYGFKLEAMLRYTCLQNYVSIT
jgi:hypothetical protein